MGLHLHQDNPTIEGTVMAASQEADTLTLPAFPLVKAEPIVHRITQLTRRM